MFGQAGCGTANISASRKRSIVSLAREEPAANSLASVICSKGTLFVMREK